MNFFLELDELEGNLGLLPTLTELVSYFQWYGNPVALNSTPFDVGWVIEGHSFKWLAIATPPEAPEASPAIQHAKLVAPHATNKDGWASCREQRGMQFGWVASFPEDHQNLPWYLQERDAEEQLWYEERGPAPANWESCTTWLNQPGQGEVMGNTGGGEEACHGSTAIMAPSPWKEEHWWAMDCQGAPVTSWGAFDSAKAPVPQEITQAEAEQRTNEPYVLQWGTNWGCEAEHYRFCVTASRNKEEVQKLLEEELEKPEYSNVREFLRLGLEESQQQQIETQFGPSNPSAPGRSHPTCGEPVSCATGNFFEAQTDLSVGGRGLGLDVTRTYNSQAAAMGQHGAFGYGWSSSFSDHLGIDKEDGRATLYQANGSTVSFTEGTGGSFTAPAWTQDALSGTEGTGYTLTLANEVKYAFAGASGRLESVTDRNGNTTALAYNGAGRLETVTDPVGRKLTFAYNSEGTIESVKDPMGHTLKYAYEGGNLSNVTLPGESSPRWQFKYDGSHRITKMTDGRGGTTTNEYDGANRVISQTDPAERTLSFEYATSAESTPETKITSHATGAVTKEVFTGGDELASITRGFGTASATTEKRVYDEAGDLTKVTDGNGHETEYGYDSAGNKTSEVDADKHETKWTYDATHDVLSTTTPDGETTTIKRDSHGNAEVIERPAPGSKTQLTKYKYNSLGELEAVTDPLERTSKYEYDGQGDRTAEADPEGDKRTWEYNGDSQATVSVSPRGNASGAEASKYTTKLERDEQGRLLAVTDPLGHKTKYAYDANGNLETQTDADGNKTKYTYDADNEPTKVEAPNGTLTETGYDGAGQVISQTDGNKHATKYVRNVLEQVAEVIDPMERKTLKEYDAAGNLTKLTDTAKRVTTNTYDAANRLTEVSFSDGKTHAIKYEYNGDGARTHISDASGETSYTFDQLDRMTESKDGHADVTKYEYDLDNEQTKITYPNLKAVTRAYDKDGRLEKVTDWLEHATRFAYDPDSELVTTTFPSGTSNVDSYAYNEADQMSEVKMSKGTETLASLAYARDNDGQRKTTTSKGLPGEESLSDTYDPNNRLTKGGAIGYEYDAADNATKVATGTYTYDKADELETGPSVKYAYNEVGERSKLTPTTGAATTYTYDQPGNLIAIERPKEGKVAGLTDTFTYDGNGLRASQTISGTKTYLAWQMNEALPQILSDGANSYLYGPGGLPIEQISSGGTVTYLHHDQQGSTRLLTGSTGTVTGSTTFDAYGNKTGSTGTTTTPLGYDAQYTNSDTGLVYLRSRQYDPATAQFTSVDPLAPITREPYAYAGNNPLNMSDPTGLFSIGDIPFIGGGLEKVATRYVGFWDGFTQPLFGGTAALRSTLGLNGGLNQCSSEYQVANQIGGFTLDGEAVAPVVFGGVTVAGLAVRGLAASEGEVLTNNLLSQIASSLPDAVLGRVKAALFTLLGTGAIGYGEVRGLQAVSPAKSGGSTCGCS